MAELGGEGRPDDGSSFHTLDNSGRARMAAWTRVVEEDAVRSGWIWIYFEGRAAGLADGLDIGHEKKEASRVIPRFGAGATGCTVRPFAGEHWLGRLGGKPRALLWLW